jgi:hypothetical protein
MMMWGSLFLISSGYVQAGYEGSYGTPRDEGQMLKQGSPIVQSNEITGTIIASDVVLQKITVIGTAGTTMEFFLDTNTPITDHNRQINFLELRPGDRVTVHYYPEPRLVNSIERI